jgi:hypothetical protein
LRSSPALCLAVPMTPRAQKADIRIARDQFVRRGFGSRPEREPVCAATKKARLSGSPYAEWIEVCPNLCGLDVGT